MITPSPEDRSACAARLLKGFWFCEGLSAADLERIARSASFRSIERGDVVIDYGSAIQHVYCVLGGMVKLLITTERRSERIVELVGAGETFGEGLLFAGQPSVGRAVAIDDGRLLLVPGSVLITMLVRSPELALRCLQRVSRRVARLLADLQADTGQSAGRRIVRWLALQLGERSGETRIRLGISKATLAASLNTTPETLSRVLRHLREQGVVRVEGREIVVMDPVPAGVEAPVCATHRVRGTALVRALRLRGATLVQRNAARALRRDVILKHCSAGDPLAEGRTRPRPCHPGDRSSPRQCEMRPSAAGPLRVASSVDPARSSRAKRSERWNSAPITGLSAHHDRPRLSAASLLRDRRILPRTG